jgi:hypothetical protein
LPGNANQLAALEPYLAKAGLDCQPAKARGVGSTAENRLVEVACSSGQGVILITSVYPDIEQAVQYIACAAVPSDSNISCRLTDSSAVLAVADNLIVQSGKDCDVADRRLFGSNAVGDLFFEVACQDGDGFVVQQLASGELGQVISCTDVGDMAGGCQFGND